MVGAGASAGCGFPLGAGLIPLLAQPLSSLCPSLVGDPDELREVEQQRRRFVAACKDTRLHHSLDQLLFHRKELRQVGALSLAAALVEKQLAVVRNRATYHQWYSDLYVRLLGPDGPWRTIRESGQPDFAVVTFNYDLNIELTIARHMSADLSQFGGAQAWDHAISCPIAHVHGQLGLDDEIVSMLDDDAYQPIVTLKLLRAVANTLALSTDQAERLDADSLLEARQWIWGASEIAFMGFGFDPTNLARIGIGDAHPEWKASRRRIYATGNELGSSRMTAAAKHCGGPIEFFDSTFGLGNVVGGLISGGYEPTVSLRSIS